MRMIGRPLAAAILLVVALAIAGCAHPLFRVAGEVDTPVEALGAVEAGITAAQDTVTTRLQEHAITLQQAEALEDQLDEAGRIADTARAALAVCESPPEQGDGQAAVAACDTAQGRINAARALLSSVERTLREQVNDER